MANSVHRGSICWMRKPAVRWDGRSRNRTRRARITKCVMRDLGKRTSYNGIQFDVDNREFRLLLMNPWSIHTSFVQLFDTPGEISDFRFQTFISPRDVKYACIQNLIQHGSNTPPNNFQKDIYWAAEPEEIDIFASLMIACAENHFSPLVAAQKITGSINLSVAKPSKRWRSWKG
jgi:hypothetical protein